MRAISVNRATLSDASAIADLLHIVWPEEKASTTQVASALREPQHIVHVAQASERIVGLVRSTLPMSVIPAFRPRTTPDTPRTSFRFERSRTLAHGLRVR